MILTDGECPSCDAPKLYLNKGDLFECPNCRLVFVTDGLLAAVMPFLGTGEFREPKVAAEWDGLGVVKAQANLPLPDLGAGPINLPKLGRLAAELGAVARRPLFQRIGGANCAYRCANKV